MNRLFGSSSSKPKPSLNDAIASTDTRIDSIEVKIRKLDAELTKYRDQMRKMRDGPGKVRSRIASLPRSFLVGGNLTRRLLALQSAVQQRALRVLKQKKLYESQIGQLQQQTFNMEQASITTENLRNTMATVDAMKTANKELKKQYGKLNVDKIEVSSTRPAVLDWAAPAHEPGPLTANALRYGGPDRASERGARVDVENLWRAGRSRRSGSRSRQVNHAHQAPFLAVAP